MGEAGEVAGSEVGGDAVEGKLALGGTVFPSGLGHAVNHTAGLVLGKSGGTFFAQTQEALGAVLAHAGEDAGHGLGAGAAVGGRFEEQVHGGALVPDLRAVGHAHAVVVAVPAEQHVKIAGGDEGHARVETFAIHGLAHREGADTVEPVGVGLGEAGRDVLDDGDAGQAGGQGSEHLAQGFGAAGGGAEEDERARVGAQRGRQGALDGGGAHRGEAHAGGGRGLDHRDEARAEGAEGARTVGFAEHVHRAELEGLERVIGPALRQGAEHDDRHRPMLHEQAQEGEAVHARHFQVEREHVGLQLADAVARLVGIAGGADNLDGRVGAEGVGGDLPHEGGIIDDEDTDFAHDGHGFSGSTGSPFKRTVGDGRSRAGRVRGSG